MAQDLREALEELLDDEEIVGAEGVCPVLYEPGDPRLILVTGENAGGKTFLAELLGALHRRANDDKVEVIPVSMRSRTESGMHRVFMFGDEGWESTGRISIKAIRGALRTCAGRESDHVLILDEPDVGLSESYQGAIGALLREFAAGLPDHTNGLVVVTHSRAIASALLAHGPTCLRVGDDLRPTREWLANPPVERTVADIEALEEKALERFQAITRLREQRQAARKKAGMGM